MKVGVLTLHRSQNYGGLLQSYALQRVLAALGVNSEIIDYWYPGSDNALYGTSFADCKSINAKLRFALDGLLCASKGLRGAKLLRIQRSIDFVKRHLSGESYPDYESLTAKARGYDAYICGSDQVWNPNYGSAYDAFRLGFVPEGRKKISYAASFGVPSLTPAQASACGEALRGFHHISVRERDGLRIVKDLTGKDAELVLDPTLLLTFDDWAELLLAPRPTEKYILCYFLGDNKATQSTVYDFQRQHPMPIYTVGYHPLRVLNRKLKTVVDAGPIQFLSLFAGASHVFTNSFHGTVFSILFKKPFHTFVDTNAHRMAMSSRISSLTELLGLEGRICESGSRAGEAAVDYGHVLEILSSERAKSIDFLKMALGI